MVFICDVCPETVSEGRTVIIGFYEEWIKHLLSFQHQAKHTLVMNRKTYWPNAEYTCIVKNLPRFDEETSETYNLYLDIMMKLSEFGFIEAISYSTLENLNDVFVAIQLHYTKAFPDFITTSDNKSIEVKLLRKPTSATKALCKGRDSFNGKRLALTANFENLNISEPSPTTTQDMHRRVLNELVNSGNVQKLKSNASDGQLPDEKTQKLTSENIFIKGESSKPLIDSTTNVVETKRNKRVRYDQATLIKYCQVLPTPPNESLNPPVPTVVSTPTSVLECTNVKKKRIQYDPSTLLKFCGITAMPRRFSDVLEFPIGIIELEAKAFNIGHFNMAKSLPCINMNVGKNNALAKNFDKGLMRPNYQYRKDHGETRWNQPVNQVNVNLRDHINRGRPM